MTGYSFQAPPIRFQALSHQVEIAADDPGVRAALAYLAQDAVHAEPPKTHLAYAVVPLREGGFVIFENGREIARGLDAVGAMHLIYRVAHGVVLGALPPHLRLHAGCATLAGRRVLFVGHKGAGKTTLMLRLLFDGVEVHGDELVLVPAEGDPQPFPRRFHVRASSLPLVADLAAVLPRVPSTPASEEKEGLLHAFAPTDAGFAWQVAPAPVDAVVFLSGGHGEATAIRTVTKVGALRRLRRHTTFPERSAAWFSVLLRLVDSATGYLLYNGDPAASAAVLAQTFQEHSR